MPHPPQRAFTKAELRIMEMIWERGSATVAEIVAALPPPPLAYTTVLTVLRVLERKGAVAHEPAGRAHVYRALVERDAAAGTAIGDVLSSFFANSKAALALRLLSEERPSQAEIERIKSVISDYEKEAPVNAADFICAFAANAFWQSTLLVLAAWGVLRAFHRANATTRYAIWLGVLAASILLPLAATIATAPRTAVPPAMNSSFGAHAAAGRTAVIAPLESPRRTPALESAPPARFSRARYTLPAIVGTVVAWTWSAIAAVLLLRLAVSLLHIERLKRDALPLAPERRERLATWSRADRGARDVRLCVSDRVSVPTAIGLFDAMILIPKDLERHLDAMDLDRIVLHELAHLRRRDDWSNAFARMTASLLFFSPAVAFAVAQLDLEREVACDDSVLLYDAEALTYANTLARMSEIVAWPHRPVAAPGIFMTRRGMSLRIERILEDGRDVRARLATGPAALVLGAIAAISLTGVVTPSIAFSPAGNQAVTSTPLDDAAPAEIAYSGTWELRYYKGRSESDRTKALLFDLHYPSGFSNWSVPADLKTLGIPPERLRAAEGTISFVITREAGTFDCKGVAGNGVGRGEFRFQPNAAYAAEYASLGMKLSLRDQVVAGMADVPLDYVRGLAAIGLMPMSFQSLIGLKMMGGSLEQVRSLRRDFPSADAAAITSFVMMQSRMPDTHSLHAMFPNAQIDDVMTMGMAGVTPDYVGALRKAEVRGLSANNVTALRSAGVDKAFVERMIAEGKTGLTIDEVVALKKSGF